jgi:hypothetical protein
MREIKVKKSENRDKIVVLDLKIDNFLIFYVSSNLDKKISKKFQIRLKI